MSIDVRTAVPADLPAIHTVGMRAFGEDMSAAAQAEMAGLMPAERHVVAVDGPDIVGVTALMPLTLTVPGGAQLPTAGISNVTVAATHRRRGVLRSIFTAQHQGLLADYPLAALTASEATIYPRFGYGPATVNQRVEIDRRAVTFAATAPDPGGVRQLDAATARERVGEVHARWQSRTPGALHRSASWWDWQLADRAEDRRGASGLFFLVHPDGYATYRARDARAEVVEVVAATDAAHAALWRVLLGLDFADTVSAVLAPDDALPWLLTDTRAVRLVRVRDGLWVRVLNVPAALSARRCAVELDVVLEVADGFLGRGGRFRLRGGPDGAECARTDAPAAVACDVADLGSLYLGGHRASGLARAGRLTGEPAALARLDLALLTEQAPAHGTDF